MAVLKAKGGLRAVFLGALKKPRKSSAAAADSATRITSVAAGISQALADDDKPLTNFLKSTDSSVETGQDHGEAPLSYRISSILCGNHTGSSQISETIQEERYLQNTLQLPSFSKKTPECVSLKFKENSRRKKQKYAFKNTQSHRFKRLLKGSAEKLGTNTMFHIFGRMGQHASVKEFNVMIELSIEQAMRSNNLEYVLDQIEKIFKLFKLMIDRGFPIEEGTYGPVLDYLIDMEMIEEFQAFKDVMKEAGPDSSARLGYYEMLLWIQVNDEEHIEEICSTINDNRESLSSLEENYLAALCERDQKDHLQKFLETLDIAKVSSFNLLQTLFRYLGRSLMESMAKKFLLELKESDEGIKNIPKLVLSYAACTQDSKFADSILKFHKLHEELEIKPLSESYEKLIKHACDSFEVETALDIVENMLKEGLIISSGILQSLLNAIEQINEFSLVRRIYSIMCHKNIEPNTVIFRSMISLCMRIKDFEGAYNMLDNLKKHNLMPTSGMYNSILAGYYRQKNPNGAAKVIKQMREDDVKLDSLTFSFLINNCDRNEDITEYWEEMKQAGVQPTKHVYMSLINAYAACGQLEKAKQVVMDKDIPSKHLNEVKSVLISAFASTGELTEALRIYEEMKKADCTIEPKAIISLVEHFDSKGDFNTLIRLLDEIDDSKSWVDGFFRVILFALRNNHSSCILDLMKQTKYPLSKDDMIAEYLFEEVFWAIAEMEHSDVKLGVGLVRHMKEELGFSPTRKGLDFLLSACVNAKDKHSALLIWNEYPSQGLPYNVLTFLRMYQVLLAAGDPKGAKAIASKISKEDRDVHCIMIESQKVYSKKTNKKRTKRVALKN